MLKGKKREFMGRDHGGEFTTGQSNSAPTDEIAQGSAKLSADFGADSSARTPKSVKKVIEKVTNGKLKNLSGSVSHEIASTSTTGEKVGFNLPTVDSLVNSVEAGAGKGSSASLTVGVSGSGTVNFRNLAKSINSLAENISISRQAGRTREEK